MGQTSLWQALAVDTALYWLWNELGAALQSSAWHVNVASTHLRVKQASTERGPEGLDFRMVLAACECCFQRAEDVQEAPYGATIDLLVGEEHHQARLEQTVACIVNLAAGCGKLRLQLHGLGVCGLCGSGH